MLKTKLNVLTLRKEPLPTVIFHEPEAIELSPTAPLMNSQYNTERKVGCKLRVGYCLAGCFCGQQYAIY